MGQHKEHTAPKHILVNNKKVRDEKEIADYFNNYLTDSGLNLTSKIDTTGKYPFQHYLGTHSDHFKI